MRRTFPEGFRLIKALVGLPFLIFGIALIVVAFTHSFRNNRGVRTEADARQVAIMTGAVGTLCTAIGLGLILFASGTTIDASKKTVRAWTAVGPFRFGRVRKLSDFDRVCIVKTGGNGSPFLHHPALSGRGSPVDIDDDYPDRERALKAAREIARFAGLPVEGDAPPAPSKAQVNRALEVFQTFGPERRIEVEQRWTEKLPDVHPASHPLLRARCEEFEAVAAELAEKVLDRKVSQTEAESELARRCPDLDPGRVSHTLGQAIYFASK